MSFHLEDALSLMWIVGSAVMVVALFTLLGGRPAARARQAGRATQAGATGE